VVVKPASEARSKGSLLVVAGDKVVVRRHSAFDIIWHWVNFAAFLVVILTGWQVYTGWQILGDTPSVSLLHFDVAIFLAFWNFPIFLYQSVVSGELPFFLLRVSDFGRSRELLKAFLGLSSHRPEYCTYDVDCGRYYRKYNPLHKTHVWVSLLLLLLLGATGLLMYFASPTLDELTGGLANLRALHLSLFYAFTFFNLGHIYFASIPQNWEKMTKSIFNGRAKARIHRSTVGCAEEKERF